MPDQLQALHLEHTFLHVQHSNITLIEPQMMTPGSINGAPRDDGSDDNDRTGNGDPVDEPDNEGPDDLQDNPDNSKHGMENNLADAITALARNVQHQGDSPRSKVREPNPFDGTDPAKLRTFLVQLRLSFNDRPHTFTNDQNKVNFAISLPQGHRTRPLRELPHRAGLVKPTGLGRRLRKIYLRVENLL